MGRTPTPDTREPVAQKPGTAAADLGREQVILLDPSGAQIGVADKAGVHTKSTPLHLAFSCYLIDDVGRVLLTRRALAKVAWPGVWTNSCCGHPRPGEDPEAAVGRHLDRELGASASDLRLALPTFAYRAVDPSGVVENEVCPVWIGRLASAITPDPAEVMDMTWIEWDELVNLAAAAPDLLSPWCVQQTTQLATLAPPELYLT